MLFSSCRRNEEVQPPLTNLHVVHEVNLQLFIRSCLNIEMESWEQRRCTLFRL